MSPPTCTAADVLEALSRWEPWRSGEPLPQRSTLRKWRSRGLLPDHGKDRDGHALYVAAEVYDVARRHAHRDAT